MPEIDYSQFNVPSSFVLPKSHKAVQDGQGVSTFDYGEGYVAWRFAFSARPWKPDKVKKYRLDASDTIPVLLFYRNKDNQVPIKLRRKMRYEERIDRFGTRYDKAFPLESLEEHKKSGTDLDLWELPIGFEDDVFQVAFERWKKEGAAPGTPLSAWRADPGQINTLAAMGLFTVDALGQLSEELFKSKLKNLPPSIQGPLLELHEMAIAYVNSQAGMVDASQFGDKIEALENYNEKLKEELENKDDEIKKLLAKIKGTSGRDQKKQVVKKHEDSSDPQFEVVDGEIKEI